MTIETNVEQINVEIDGVEYPLTPHTIETNEKLIEAAKKNEGKPLYCRWLAEMEIVLGKTALKKIFPNGKRENIDRMRMIYNGVVFAFKTYENSQAEEDASRRREEYTLQVEPLLNLINSLNKIEKNANAVKTIPKR